MQEDLKGLEPTLNAEAGLTPEAARAAHGYADDQLHAGFINKQHVMPKPEGKVEAPRPPSSGADIPEDVMQGLEVEPAEEREPMLNAEAGLTPSAARAAGGFADDELNAGFVSKQHVMK